MINLWIYLLFYVCLLQNNDMDTSISYHKILERKCENTEGYFKQEMSLSSAY